MGQVNPAGILTYQGPELDLYGNYAKGQQQSILRDENVRASERATREQQTYEQQQADREKTRGILSSIDPNNPDYEKLALSVLSTDPQAAATLLGQAAQEKSLAMQEREFGLRSKESAAQIAASQAATAAANAERVNAQQERQRQLYYERVSSANTLTQKALKSVEGIQDPEQAKEVLDKYMGTFDALNADREAQGLLPIDVPDELKTGDFVSRVQSLTELGDLFQTKLDVLNSLNPDSEAVVLGEGDTLVNKSTGAKIASGAAKPDDGKNFEAEDKLRDEYNTLSKDYFDISKRFETIKRSASDPSAAGDVSLIYAYMKMLDPGSTVMQGEQATAAEAGSIPERVWGQYNQALSGQKFTDAIRNDFVSRAEKIYKGAEKSQKPVKERYEKLAKRNKLDPENVVGGTLDMVPPPDAETTENDGWSAEEIK